MVNKIGNPNIASIKRTGPTTDVGKLKNVIAVTAGRGQLIKNETPLLKRMRICNKCPLGEKKFTIQVGDKLIKRTKPADCSYYEKDKDSCVIPVTEWAIKVKTFSDLGDNTFDLQKSLILEAVSEAKTAGDIEKLKKGHSGFYTKEFLNMALTHVNEYNKIITQQANQKHLHLHQHQEQGDMGDRIVERVFEEKEDGEGKD